MHWFRNYSSYWIKSNTFRNSFVFYFHMKTIRCFYNKIMGSMCWIVSGYGVSCVSNQEGTPNIRDSCLLTPGKRRWLCAHLWSTVLVCSPYVFNYYFMYCCEMCRTCRLYQLRVYFPREFIHQHFCYQEQSCQSKSKLLEH